MTLQWVYVGAYTDLPGGKNGITLYSFDPASGKLTFVSAVSDVVNPSFFAISADRRFLFAVNEVDGFAGQPGGGLSAYTIHPATGALTFLNAQPTHGAHPCYVSLDRAGKWAFVANYTGGSLTIFPIHANGHLGTSVLVDQHHGQGVDPVRQDAAHVHSAILDPSERLLLVADLGLDQISIEQFDHASGKLLAHDPAAITTASAAGPRHMTFHPNGRWFYQINELNSTVCAFTFDGDKFAEIQTISTLPADFIAENTAADLHASPDGRFLYASNRGHDSITVYAIDAGSGRLAVVEWVSTGGTQPRNFGFDLTGRYCFAANQSGGSLVSFRVDPATGRLALTGDVIRLPYPVCVRAVAASA